MRSFAKRTWLILGAMSVASLGCRHSQTRSVPTTPACDHCSVIVASRTSDDPKVMIVETPMSTGTHAAPITVKPVTEPKAMPSTPVPKSMSPSIPVQNKDSVIPQKMPTEIPKAPRVPPMKESISGALELPKFETSLPSETVSPPVNTPVTIPVPEKTLPRTTSTSTSLKPSVSLDRKGRAADYTWLVGELEYSKHKNTWRVRYANYDVEDRFGGSVTLVGADDLLEALKDGDLIKVEGQLLSTTEKAVAPQYRVIAVKKLD